MSNISIISWHTGEFRLRQSNNLLYDCADVQNKFVYVTREADNIINCHLSGSMAIEVIYLPFILGDYKIIVK